MWNEEVPRDRVANLEFRRYVLQRALSSRRVRKGLMEVCKRDILFWINAFGWQFNPNAIGDHSVKIGPFVTWPYQDRALLAMQACVRERRDLVIEKSREMGASWLLIFLNSHTLLFERMEKVLVVSRSEKLVYSPVNSDSLYWKTDFVHSHLPSWMVEGLTSMKMSYLSERTGSMSTGEATTSKIGVGGRASWIMVDEFGQFDEDYEVYDKTAATSNCRIFNGTHKGTTGMFFELCQGGFCEKLQMHWSEHPDKIPGAYRFDKSNNDLVIIDKQFPFPPDYEFDRTGKPTGGPFPTLRSPWYDLQAGVNNKPGRIRSDRGVAEDLDIDPAGSTDSVFDTYTIRSLQGNHCCDPIWQGDMEYDPTSSRPLRLVPAKDGQLKLWVNPTPDGKMPAGRYMLGCDISTGMGATPSCISGIDAPLGQKVLELSCATKYPEEFAGYVVALARLCADAEGEGAHVIWERAGPGHTFGKEVMKAGYRRVYDGGERSYPFDSKKETAPGWYPSPIEKRKLIEEYRRALKLRQLTNPSKSALEECLKFRYTANGSSVEHPLERSRVTASGANVNHGDMVIADALAWKISVGLQTKVAKEEAAAVPVGSMMWRRMLGGSGVKEVGAWV